jgi:hypothetical protein
VLDVVCPVAFEYFPAMQLVHDVTAVDPEYVPAAQSVQTDRSFEYFPAGHAAQCTDSQKSDAVMLCAFGKVESLARTLFLASLLSAPPSRCLMPRALFLSRSRSLACSLAIYLSSKRAL